MLTPRSARRSTTLAATVLLAVAAAVGSVPSAGAAGPSPAAYALAAQQTVVHRTVVQSHVLQANVESPRTVAAHAAYRANPTNPLAGRVWGTYKGASELVYRSYTQASGFTKKMLAKVALRPKAHWFGSWTPDDEIRAVINKYIEGSQDGHPNRLVSMSIFRMVPWEQEIKKRLPTRAEQASYKRWILNCAAAIGRAHVALILQPDGPFALDAPHHSTLPSQLLKWSAKVFSALPNTSVYIEIGSRDWLFKPYRAANLLVADGIRYARGFALNGTHYDSTVSEIDWGASIIGLLDRRGYHNRHFVVDTAENGRPFTYQQYTGDNFNNAAQCTTMSQRRCVTLGIPPTWRVADTQWRLPDRIDNLAARLVDGYIWFGRPYLRGQTYEVDVQRTVDMGRTTPY